MSPDTATGFRRPPSTTVVVATYNQHEWLSLVLAGLAAQTDLGFDVIVADDGSDPPIADALVERASELPFRVYVLRQPDEGFRKARLQNAAARHSDSELLIFVDGDCLPFRNLVAEHRNAARPNEFVAGAVCYLDAEFTATVSEADVRAGAHEARLPAWETTRMIGVHLKNRWHTLTGKRTRPRFKGGNFSVCAELLREVDGFDEEFLGFGKEDSDLRNRMRNAGARGISLWHRARVCHLFWPRPFGSGRERPDAALYDKSSTRIRARRGLSTHEAEPAGAADRIEHTRLRTRVP